MELILDRDEAEILEGLLERCLSDLREEIHHTDHAAYKADLKADEALMRSILAKLTARVSTS